MGLSYGVIFVDITIGYKLAEYLGIILGGFSVIFSGLEHSNALKSLILNLMKITLLFY
jgi:hypothetical protein